MTDIQTQDPIEAGLRAWAAGDLEALAAVLAPEVTHVYRINESTYLVRSDEPHPEPFPVATRITVTGGRVTAMQQVRATPTDV